MLLRISEGLAVAAILCSLIPKQYGVAFAVSYSHHIGFSVRHFVPFVLLMISGLLSAAGLAIMLYGRLSAKA